jgi:hypothetical protein
MATVQCCDAHVEEDAVEDRHRDPAQNAGHHHGQADQQEGDDSGDPLFTKKTRVKILLFFY